MSNGEPSGTTLVTPTLLPCSISPGTTTFDDKLWDPEVKPKATPDNASGSSADATPQTEVLAYFRGRRLFGPELQLPEGCRGVIPDQTKLAEARRLKESAKPSADALEIIDLDGEGDGEVADVKLPVIEPQYHFQSLRILGHEGQPSLDLPAMRAMREWADLARSIHQDG